LSKAIPIILLIIILVSLAQSLFYLINDKGNESKRTVKTLTLRIGLSLLLFVFLIIAGFMGWIQPHGLLPPPQ